MAEIEVTLKAGPSYSDPWIRAKGESVEDLSNILKELREEGGYSIIKSLAVEFQSAPAAGVETVQAAIPGTEVVSDEPAPTTAPPTAAASGAAQPVEQSTPPCEKCGGPTRFGNGTGRTGAWSAYFCKSGDQSHTKFL